jgi:beta-glucuronidase
MRQTLVVVFLAALSFAQTSGEPLNNPSGRTTISLNGPWHVIVDPLETGMDARFYQNRKPKNKSDLVEYDFDSSETLNVPGDWNTQKEKLLFYEGPVWYEKSFVYQKRTHTRVFVYFGAVNFLSRVYLNGEKLGEHEGGFTPFNFDVTEKIKDGANFFVVEVNDQRRADAVPALKTDWWNYGGITRDVLLVETADTYIRDYWIQSARQSANEIAGWAQLEGGRRAGQQVVVEIPEAGVKQSATTDASGRAEFHFSAKLELWSPENPKLYDVALSAGADTVHDHIGFRTVETRGSQIVLNGKPVFLRGISIHEEAPVRGGRAYSEDDARTLFKWAKDLGCNFVRLAHYPHNENEIREADRVGLLVWSEIPVYWDIAWTNPETLANAKQQLQESIARDHNRASVIFWSLSNETPVRPDRTEFLKSLADEARKLDPTRLITSALNHVDDDGPDHRVLNDPAGSFLDVLGLNEYYGWYFGRPEDADRQLWSTRYEKPLIVSEFGAETPYGKHGDSATRWTEEYQANLYVHQLTMIDKIPGLAGLSPWLLMDFRSPRRPLTGIQDYFNRKGLLSDKGDRKQAFSILQKYYREKARSEDAIPKK